MSISARRSRSLSTAVSDLTRLLEEQGQILISNRIVYIREPINAMFVKETIETIDRVHNESRFTKLVILLSCFLSFLSVHKLEESFVDRHDVCYVSCYRGN